MPHDEGPVTDRASRRQISGARFAHPVDEAETPLKVAVGAFIIRADGKMLVTSRKTDHTDLGLPGGKVDPGETEGQALVRELREETSLVAKKYQRLFAGRDSGDFWFVTYLVFDLGGPVEETWSLDSFVNREGAVVRWVEPLQLIQPNCSFRDYNRALLQYLGLMDEGSPP